MSNRAWMPLHIDDYLSDTAHLSGAEHGAYLLLIMHYWQNGGLPENERLIARIARMDAAQWEESRDILAMLFGPNWAHKRIDAELAKADDIIEKRRAAAEAKHSRRKTDAHAVHVQSKKDAHASTRAGTPLTDNLSDTVVSEEKRASARRFSPGFDQFWSIYPNRVGKREAEKAFLKAIGRADIETILSGLRRYAAKTDDRPWCNPATWLNQDRWDDAPAAVVPQPRATAPPGRRQNAVEALVAHRSRERQHEPSGPIVDHRDDELLPPDKPELRGLVGNLGQALRWPVGSGDH